MTYIKLMFLSMVPIIELRGAIPLGIAINLKPFYVYCVCVIGATLVAIPIVLLFRNIIEYLRHKKYFNKIIRYIDIKIEGRTRKLKAVSIIGIIVFVGIPLPTTGSWSAAAIASILKMRLRDSILGIFIGNAIAGIIMSVLTLHLTTTMSIDRILLLAIVVIIIVSVLILFKKKYIRNIKYCLTNKFSKNQK
ncbi:membrane protein [[Clostridium] sordellii]|uniref:COG2426 family protein n=1 Tax=Paraclostridium sordellii TaxID=1505 RepID=UPI0005E14750|nr:small multi-drug export protein [Paeniclostridium sordellii]MBX9180831.1 small multi-drug export protein [Paeniclostridium sordellii]MDU1454579.1 small multi-drug export protein [Paeniclostridium sordellii]CEO10855.1 membrane protein [[Clostridium] sordellii] [Paeniclostridium sordellii]CEO12820.1 membrane protein [[Clostridium] sordellii] [Paeniclostridium sordellii]CEP85244.1 membrane protein [[Clostridium] sordellii] [Paeniclostridium sordellii]